MEWIARIYRHHTKYGIIINYADGSVFTLFNVDGYTKLKELVKQNKDIALPSINQLQFVSCGEIKSILKAHISTFFDEYDKRIGNEKAIDAVADYCYNEMQGNPLIAHTILHDKEWNWKHYITQTVLMMLIENMDNPKAFG